MQRILQWGGLLFLLAACVAQPNAQAQSGRVLLWHSLNSETEQQALDNILARFTDIYEGVDVITRSFEQDDIRERYTSAATAGLGPNLVLGENSWVRPLADAGLITDLTPLEPRTDVYYTGALTSLRYNEGLYGLPFAVRPVALYYNRDMVETPVTTLDDLLATAEAGNRVGISTQFEQAFWGTQAFGGQLFDADGRVVLNRGGFTNWLRWLREAEQSAGVFLARDTDTLLDLFARERIAYMAGTPDLLTSAREQLSAENVGVVALPSGPAGPAGPLLRVDALMLNPASSQNQTELSMLLARFMTNADQGGLLIRETGIVPANRRVRVDAVAYPAAAGFRTQVQTAVPIPNLPQMTDVLTTGDALLTQVLEGVISEAEAAQTLATTVNERYGFEDTVVDANACDLAGELTVWHGLEGNAADALAITGERYIDRCPDVTLVFEQRDEDELLAAYQEDGSRADMLLGNHDWLPTLIADNAVQPPTLDRTELQIYLASALEEVTVNNELYGIPLTLEMLGLYYNREQVSTPATTLQDLQAQIIEDGRSIALPITFDETYWGFTAYGGRLTNDGNTFTFDANAWLDWLIWLNSVGSAESTIISTNEARLRQQFAEENTTYYVGYPRAMNALTDALGTETLGIATLPGGPGGEASTPLTVRAFFIGAGARGNSLALSHDFARFATQQNQQQQLLDDTGLIPANVNIIVPADSPMRPWFEQIETARPLPNLPETDTLRERGTEVIRRTATGSLSPQEGVSALAEVVDITITLNDDGLLVTPTPATTPQADENAIEETGGDA